MISGVAICGALSRLLMQSNEKTACAMACSQLKIRSGEALSKAVAGPDPQWDEQFLLNVPNSFTNRLHLQIRRMGGLITSGIEVGSADIAILDLEGCSSEKQTLQCSNGRAEIDAVVRWAPFRVGSSNVSAELRQRGDSDQASLPQSEDSSLNLFTRQLSQKRSFASTSYSFEGMVYMVVHRAVTESFCPTPISVTAFVQGSHSMKSTQGQQMRPRREGFEAFFQDETLELPIQNSQETQICFQLVNKVGSEQGKLGYAMLSFAEVLQRESQREYSGQATTGAVAHHLWEIPLLPDGTLHVSMYWNVFE
ncbi:hypothetical protein CYMTET_20063 [Cymbomonas tetramitiformis]|uniref:C2 domain-containing protein n=1 Tax=Cymbomonas tetramitiformis TaxID=36881 RepID=A0AAE0G4V0_9CHLO|nr:hypothetical protein CYMTET_20063 [Cymbomonas tetramitiformis]